MRTPTTPIVLSAVQTDWSSVYYDTDGTEESGTSNGETNRGSEVRFLLCFSTFAFANSPSHRATFGTADTLTPELMGPSNTPWVGRAQDGATTLATGVKAPDLSETGVEGRLATREMDGAIVAHLLERASGSPLFINSY
jgi:hypothetical protein